ncbi:unnamed protein product [Cylindrotheca closterium]|uniref:Uncharacterized protein n=1 Tax=Cylindrotheca closterium TaxID=2856 RepID=A0AAD2FMD4_9STRA|nr:unnamed protein product [Cylindrotheca closterium]
MDLDCFLPSRSSTFRATRCICMDPMCRLVQQRFKKVNDARGGFFTVPAATRSSYNPKEVAVASMINAGSAEPKMVVTTGEKKRRMVELLMGGGNGIPQQQCFVAMLHFSPYILRKKCLRKRGTEHVYCWLLPKRCSDDGESVAPNYPIQDAERDVLETKNAVNQRPVYTRASRKSTEEMVKLFLGNRTKLTRVKRKRIRDYAQFVKNQLKKGKKLPLEKESRLEQIGFFDEFPRPEILVGAEGEGMDNLEATPIEHNLKL